MSTIEDIDHNEEARQAGLRSPVAFLTGCTQTSKEQLYNMTFNILISLLATLTVVALETKTAAKPINHALGGNSFRTSHTHRSASYRSGYNWHSRTSAEQDEFVNNVSRINGLPEPLVSTPVTGDV
jgi:hypothetical protein